MSTRQMDEDTPMLKGWNAWSSKDETNTKLLDTKDIR